MANPLDTLLQKVRSNVGNTASRLFGQAQSFVQNNPTPAGFVSRNVPQIQKVGNQFAQNANQFIQGGINKAYGSAPFQVPNVVKPFTALPEMGREFAKSTLTDLNLGVTTGRPETNRLHELTTKRRTPQEQKEFINLASNEGLQLAMGMVGGGEKLNTEKNLTKAYQEFAHNLGAVIKQAGRKFTQEELDNAINVLAKAPIESAPDAYHKNASAIARYIQGVKSGLLVNKPGGVGLQAKPLRSVQEAETTRLQRSNTQEIMDDALGMKSNQPRLYGGENATGFKNEGSFSSMADKKMRFEIDDSGAKVRNLDEVIKSKTVPSGKGNIAKLRNEYQKVSATNPFDRRLGEILKEIEQIQSGAPATTKPTVFLQDILDHPTLYENYPQLRGAVVKKQSGLASRAQFRIDETGRPELTFSTEFTRDPQTFKSELLHEIQHAIQEKEGFARGGSPDKVYPDEGLRKLAEDYQSKLAQLDEKYMPGIRSGNEKLREILLSERAKLQQSPQGQAYIKLSQQESPMNQFTNYQRLAGEVEARDVQSRMNLTPQQRATTQPYQSQGIPVKDQIVRFDSGVSASKDVAEGRLMNSEIQNRVQQNIDNGMSIEEAVRKAQSETIAPTKPTSQKGKFASAEEYARDEGVRAKAGIVSEKQRKDFFGSEGVPNGYNPRSFYENRMRKAGFSEDQINKVLGRAKEKTGTGAGAGFDSEDVANAMTDHNLSIRDQLRAEYNQSTPPTNVTKGRLSDVYKGKEFSFVRNPEKAPNVGNRFGQNIEPAGKYMNLMEEGQTYTPPGWETGKVKFNNPLVIDWGEGYQSGNNWKNVLSKQYGGKTGKALSDAIRKDGYDGIITLDKGKPSEVVSLVKPNVAQPPIGDINSKIDLERSINQNVQKIQKDFLDGKITIEQRKALAEREFARSTAQPPVTDIPSTGGEILYHGTTKQFDNFDLSKAGTRNPADQGFAGKGIYLSNSKEVAETFASGKDIFKTQGQTGKGRIIETRLAPNTKVLEVNDFGELSDKLGLPRADKRPPNQKLTDFISEQSSKIRDKAQSMGYDAIKVDGGGIDKYGTPTYEIVVFDPKNIKQISSGGEIGKGVTKGVQMLLQSKPLETVQPSTKALLNPEVPTTPIPVLQTARIEGKGTGQNQQSLDSIISEGRKQIKTGGAKEENRTFRQAVSDLYTQWVDRYNPIVKASQQAKQVLKTKGASLRPEYDPEYLVRRLTGAGGIADQRFQTELKPIIDQVDQLKINKLDLDTYLANKRIAGFGTAGRDIYGADPKKAQEIVSALETKYGEKIKGIAEKLYAYQDKGLSEMSDFISPEAMSAMRKQNPDYSPLYRAMDDASDYLGLPTRKTMQGSQPFQKIKGSTRQIESPLESIIGNTFTQRAAIEKNRVAKAIVGLQDVADLGFKKVAKSGNDTVTVWKNGKKEFWQVGADIADVAKGVNEENMNLVLKVLQAPAALLRQGATGRNPEFMLPNIIRDQLDAGITSKYGYIPFVDFAKGVWEVAKKDINNKFNTNFDTSLYDKWANSGAKIDLGSMSGKKSIKAMFDEKTAKKGLFSWIGKGLDVLGKYSEQPTRVGLFKRAFGKTGNEMLAAMESRDATVDFARMGSKMKVANSIIPFLNVGVQGFDKLIRAVQNNPGKVAVLAGIYGAAPQIASTIYNLKNFPQEYAEIPQYEKDSNFVLVKGRNERGNVDYVTIPKGNVLPVIANPIQSFLEYVYGVDGQSFSKMAMNVLSDALPVISPGGSAKEIAIKTIGSNIPQAVKPIAETLLNKSFYKYDPNKEQSKDIVPYFLQNRPAYKQAYEFTPQMYQKIGAVVNVSPLQVQNIMEGYLAGYSKIPAQIIDMMTKVSRGEDVETNDKTILRRFIKETYPSSAKPAPKPIQSPNLMERITGKASAAGPIDKPLEDWQIQDEKYKLKQSDKKYAEVGNTIFYKKSNGDIGQADISKTPEKPTLTGQAELDKKLLSSYYSDVTSQANDIVDLYEVGKLTAQEANTKLTELKALKSSGKSKKAPKVSMARIKMPKLKRLKSYKPKKIKIKKIKLPKIKLLKAQRV